MVQGNPFVIGGVSTYPALAPVVAYDGRAGEYLVAWTHVYSDTDAGVFARRVAADGTPKAWHRVAYQANSMQQLPALSYGQDAHLVVWADNRSDDWVIYGRQYGALVADFTAAPVSGAAPLTVTLSDQSTPAGTVDSYEWAFGDGVTSTLANPVHVHTATGAYTVSLTVTGDDESDTVTRTHYVTVTAGDRTSRAISLHL